MTESRTEKPPAGADMALRDRVGGAALVLIGAYVIVESAGYAYGTLARIGPGLLPTGLGVLIILLGLFIIVFPERDGESAPPIVLRPAGTILAAMLAFALLVEPAGLFIASAALVFIAGLADKSHNLKTLLILYVVLSGAVWLLFVEALGIPFQLVPGFV